MKKVFLKITLSSLILLLALTIYNVTERAIIKYRVNEYLKDSYTEKMDIDDIIYVFEDGSYDIIVGSSNGIDFRLHYSDPFGVTEPTSSSYFMNSWRQEIANDISLKATNIFETYIDCTTFDGLNYNDEMDEMIENAQKIYIQAGSPPSIFNREMKEYPSFVIVISIPETDVKNENDKLLKLSEYAFSKYNIESILVYKGDFNRPENFFRCFEYEDFK